MCAMKDLFDQVGIGKVGERKGSFGSWIDIASTIGTKITNKINSNTSYL